MFTTTLPMVVFAVLAEKLVVASPAKVTLNVPIIGGGDSSAISAAILGVDSQGRTIYALNEDEMQGSSTLALATATLIKGSDYYSYTLSSPQPLEIEIGFDCHLHGCGRQLAGHYDHDIPRPTDSRYHVDRR
ncbi:hypothetical protein B0H19DRAFT_1379083 [Mycena capillaripes]|nr:hypothetical protein B0H19DRAFT_1379083 [Mycena capillaripes]